MGICIGQDTFTDEPELGYRAIYRQAEQQPDVHAWCTAPKPDEWLAAIQRASQNLEAVVCLTVASRLSASFDSARVAAQQAMEANPELDVRVIDSGTISGALNLMSMEVAHAISAGAYIDQVENVVRQSRDSLRTIAVIDTLDRLHFLARVPRILLRAAARMRIKPVVTYQDEGFKLVGRPITHRAALRKMMRFISDDIGHQNSAHIVVLHVDAPERAWSVASQLQTRFSCKSLDIAEFHPFVGLYAARGAIGVAWKKI